MEIFKKTDWARLGIILCTIIFLITAVTFEIFDLNTLPAQFFGTLLGVVITSIITVLLLQGQTKGEEKRERHMMMFEKKQEVYFQFLGQLNTILQKDTLAIQLSAERTMANDVHNLQDLIFEFGFLQMHISTETFNQILVLVGNLIQESNNIKALDSNSKDALANYYSVLTTDFFAIIGLLKNELYHELADHVDKDKIDRIIKLSF